MNKTKLVLRKINDIVTTTIEKIPGITKPKEKIYEYDTLRSQIEFLFRDAKQYTGMEDFQCRSEKKLNFHVNTSLTAVSQAKAGTVLENEGNTLTSFSKADIKVLYANEKLTEFFSKLALGLRCKKITKLYMECLDVGKMATKILTGLLISNTLI